LRNISVTYFKKKYKNTDAPGMKVSSFFNPAPLETLLPQPLTSNSACVNEGVYLQSKFNMKIAFYFKSFFWWTFLTEEIPLEPE